MTVYTYFDTHKHTRKEEHARTHIDTNTYKHAAYVS